MGNDENVPVRIDDRRWVRRVLAAYVVGLGIVGTAVAIAPEQIPGAEVALSLGIWLIVPIVVYMIWGYNGAIKTLLDDQATTNQRYEEVAFEANHDALTGLQNRNGLLAWFNRTQPSTSHALFIDLDRFKMVNDRCGHSRGDAVLREAALRIETIIAPHGVVARVGGDEFLAVIPVVESMLEAAEEVERICADLVAAVECPMGGENEEVVAISVSIGVSPMGSGEDELERAMRESDLAMYEAKAAGRNRMQVFTPELRQARLERHRVEAEVSAAVLGGEIEAWGQPILHLQTGEVTHVELLARWVRPNGLIIKPRDFLPVAERAGVMGELTDLMLAQAGAALRRFEQHDWLRNAGVAVNISGFEFARRDVATAVKHALDKYDIPSGKLVIELTESVGFDPRSAAAVFARLAELGVEMAVDDFSSTASSVGGLLDSHAAIVKIDRSLVSAVGTGDARRQGIVTALQQLGDSAGFTLVAEGVESRAEVASLLDAGVRYGQGFLFAEPKPIDELVAASTERGIAEFTSEVTDGLRATAARTMTTPIITTENTGR